MNRPIIVTLACVALLLTACDQKPRNAEDPPSGEPAPEEAPNDSMAKSPAGGEDASPAESDSGKRSETEAEPEKLLPPPQGSPGPMCVAECVKARRTEAMAAEAIELDCEQKCGECVTACVERRQGQATSPDQIAADCDRECANPTP